MRCLVNSQDRGIWEKDQLLTSNMLLSLTCLYVYFQWNKRLQPNNWRLEGDFLSKKILDRTAPTTLRFIHSIQTSKMDVKDYKAAEAYQDSAMMGELLQQLDLNQPDKLVIEEQSSIPSLMQKYMTCQAETNAQLISFMGERITTPITINGDEISILQQQHQLSTMASKSNLLTRQMDQLLMDHLNMQEGTESLLVILSHNP